MANTDLQQALHEMVIAPETNQAMSTVGGAQVAATAAELQSRREELFESLDIDRDGDEAASLAAFSAPPLPNQLGPFTWSPIVFGGGVPVGGWSQLTLFRSGAYNFSGHFHVSGAPSYNMSCVYAVRNKSGTVFTFSHRGRVHGTFEPGSRDDNWNVSGTNPAIAAGWASLCAAWSWQANAGANMDFGILLDQTIKAVGTAAAVVAIVL